MKTIFYKLLQRLKPEATNTQVQATFLAPLYTLIEQGKWDALEAKGHEMLSQHSPQQKAIELVAYSLQQAGQLKASSAIATNAIKLFPNDWIFYFLAGITLKGLGQAGEACSYLRQALILLPHDKQTIRQLTEALALSEGIELAAEKYISHCHQINTPTDILIAPIKTVRDWAKSTGLPLLEAGEIEEIPYKTPHVWGSPPALETMIGLSNKPYVAEMSNVRIFSHSSIILTHDNTALSDTAGHARFGRYVNFAYESVVLAQQPDKVLLNFNEFNTRDIEEGIFLSGLASNAFGHWLLEFLPKLQFLQQHPSFANLSIIVDADMPQSHFDHLKKLANNPLILLKAHESLRCKRLLVAPSPTFLPTEIFPNDIPRHKLPTLSPKAMRFLQAGHAKKTTHLPHRRIFLARKNMKWRRLLNEEEIATELSKFGFEKIYIEEMSMDEQVSLFQQAKWIVGANGSALNNLIYSDTSTTLLVLSQPNLFNWGVFQGPMDYLGYRSLCVCGDHTLAENFKHSDYHVPVQRIREALEYLGLDLSPP